ncbi:MAG: Z1 domain-containing protein [Anaerolineales bacterium]|nr:Z1 domain-containing protein [Anaerolineales bacterium]
MNADWLVQQFIHSRRTPEDVVKNLREGGFDETAIRAAHDEFLKLAGRVKRLSPPPMLVESEQTAQSWYPGADLIEDARVWPALKRYLLEEKHWPTSAVHSLHAASDKIVAWLQTPWAAKINTRGLVVGYVQSGKTANFTAVIAKAADAGYRFFIVLSGTKTALRSQTQGRLEAELLQLNTGLWFSPTSVSDFKPMGNNVDFFLTQKGFVLCVVKKNTTILRKLTAWLRGASPANIQQCPFLVIDDEADEASVNTARGQAGANPDDYDRTVINRRLVELLRFLPKAAYLGYTATPFANVLIDPRAEDDLYPRDFIVTLPKPIGHFGTEQIFGRERLLEDATEAEFQGLDMVRLVPEDEVVLLKPPTNQHDFVPEVTSSLADAMRYFWLATAARAVRGQANEFSTMLIHTTQLVRVHEAMRQQVEAFRLSSVQALAGAGRPELFRELEELWSQENQRVPADQMGGQPVSFSELSGYLDEVVNQCQVVVDNSRSDYRLSYQDGTRIQIAIGGNTLSRGLTLEGLVVSFFVRAAGAYDTLLQMGRWFGYRPGYADLPRMWMTSELRDNFYDLATIEAEVRQEIERYAQLGITPKEFGVRIRTHPALEITAPLKMQHVSDAAVSYDRQIIQTVIFKHRDAAWLTSNLTETDRFLQKLQDQGLPAARPAGHWIFRAVPAALVLDFLQRYKFHPGSQVASTGLLAGYIRDQNQHGSLNVWNVVVRGVTARSRELREEINLGGLAAPLLQRAKRSTSSLDGAHIGVLMSRGDIGLDLSLSPSELSQSSEDALKDKRQSLVPNTGLLIIYPIDKDSQPGHGAKGKSPLEAAEHVIGLGLVFPEAVGGSRGRQSYITVDLAPLRPADWEYDEPEAEEG